MPRWLACKRPGGGGFGLMDTVRARTSKPEFDGYLDWLKYQARWRCFRLWAAARVLPGQRGLRFSRSAPGCREPDLDGSRTGRGDRSCCTRPSSSSRETWCTGSIASRTDEPASSDGRTLRTISSGWSGEWSNIRSRDPRRFPAGGSVAGYPGVGAAVSAPASGKAGDGVWTSCGRGGKKPSTGTVSRQSISCSTSRMGLPMGGLAAHGDRRLEWDGLDEIGSLGRGESVWLGFFLHYILGAHGPDRGAEGRSRPGGTLSRAAAGSQEAALELTLAGRPMLTLRAFHDDGSEIGVEGSGVWEIDALNAAWAVIAGINLVRGQVGFETAPCASWRRRTRFFWDGPQAPRGDTKPGYLGRSSSVSRGRGENGMYCHGVQWLVGAARILAERSAREGRHEEARGFVETAYRLWAKIAPLRHVAGEAIPRPTAASRTSRRRTW